MFLIFEFSLQENRKQIENILTSLRNMGLKKVDRPSIPSRSSINTRVRLATARAKPATARARLARALAKEIGFIFLMKNTH